MFLLVEKSKISIDIPSHVSEIQKLLRGKESWLLWWWHRRRFLCRFRTGMHWTWGRTPAGFKLTSVGLITRQTVKRTTRWLQILDSFCSYLLTSSCTSQKQHIIQVLKALRIQGSKWASFLHTPLTRVLKFPVHCVYLIIQKHENMDNGFTLLDDGYQKKASTRWTYPSRVHNEEYVCWKLQSMPGKTRAAEEPQSVFTSFKNVMFGSNTPHAPGVSEIAILEF